MTSKNSSSDNFLKSQARLFGRRMACTVISFLVWFFTFPVGTCLILLQDGADAAYRVDMLSSFLGFRSWTFVFTAASAFVLAIEGISWLFSRQKVDFYESMPIKRKKRFSAIWINSFLIWLIPFAIFAFGTGAWIAAGGYLMPMVMADIGVGLLRQALLFITVYAVTTVFGLLTGNIFSAVALSFIFNIYLPVTTFLGRWLCEQFLVTDPTGINNLFTKMASWLTPAGNYYSYAGEYSGETTLVVLRYMVKKALPGDIRNLALFLVFTLIAAFLFKKRKNEMAGVSLAFPGIVPLIMILLLVPGMLMTGLVVGTILPGFTAERFVIWAILMVLIGMAANCLIEAYIEGDIRFAFRRFWAFLVAAVLAVGIFGAIFFDVFGYDSYVPSADSVKGGVFMTSQREDFWRLRTMETYDEETYPAVLVTNTEDILELGRIGQKALIDRDKNMAQTEGWETYISYVGNNDRIETRHILIPADIDRDLMDRLLKDPAFREDLYPGLGADPGLCTGVLWNNVFYYEDTLLAEGDKAPAFAEKILEAYKKDLEAAAFDQIADGRLCGILNLSCTAEGDPDGKEYNDYSLPVYRSFKKTRALLKKKEADMSVPDPDMIRSVEISYYNNAEQISRTYEDPEKIRQITEGLAGTDMYYDIPFESRDNKGINVLITWKKEKPEDYYSYSFRKGGIPGFVREDLEIAP
jgi:ABC-2 type transport system permease protein